MRSTRCLAWVCVLALGGQPVMASAKTWQLPELPGLPRFKMPKPPAAAASSSSGGGWAMAGVCAVVGSGAAAIGKKLAQADARKLKLTAAQQRSRERSYMLGWGMFGCTAGAGAAASVMQNMSEKARKAQDEAWAKAQQQTGPVAWSEPDSRTRGTTEIVERERMPDGGECGTRRDVIEAEEGTAEPMARVCRTANGTEWRPVTA